MKTKTYTATDERSTHQAKRLQKKTQHKKIYVLLGVTIGMLVIIFTTMILFRTITPLSGRWIMDEVTSYEFHSDGDGTMKLPTTEYEFTYTIDGDELSIDFMYDGAKDAQYMFQLDGTKLILEGGNGASQGTYVLHREE